MKKYIFALSILATSLSACAPQPVSDPNLPQASATPTAMATDMPTAMPSTMPSSSASAAPSAQPSTAPSQPASTAAPTATPMMTATPMATSTPEAMPTLNPSVPSPLNLRVTDRTGTNIFVSWTAPSTSSTTTYNLYRNGERVGTNVDREFYSFADLSPNSSYTLAIETVTNQGLSNRVMITSTTSGVNSGGGGNGGGATVTSFTQVERLARPAINEGLIRQDIPERAQLLKTWNSVPPSVDTADIPAAAEIRTEAVTVLGAIQSQVEIVLGYDNSPGKPMRDTNAQNTRVGQIASVFLPDVMRIDTTGPSGYATGITDLAAPRPFRGRRIDEDVIDITLAVLVPGGALDPLDPMQPVIDQVETDNVEYTDLDDNMMRIHDDIPTTFPYLAAPN
jgi:hypothetical protein